MRPSSKLLMALAFTVTVVGVATAHEMDDDQVPVIAKNEVLEGFPAIGVSEMPGGSNHRTVTRFATQLDGDHSLIAATVAEQAFTRYTLYAVRLQFASGAEQSIAVMAPPGGLQPEMHDMSGDNVANDVVLTSRLLGLPLIILLNEGHDHLVVAVSPNSFASSDGQASSPHQVHRASALVSSRFKPGEPGNGGWRIVAQLQEKFFPPDTPTLARNAWHVPNPGRAPPAVVPQSHAI